MTRRLRLGMLAAALVLAAPTTASTFGLRQASAQTATNVVVVAVGDISPPPADPTTNDMATAAIAIGANPAKIALLGDLQYERGLLADFRSTRGYTASWGRPTLYQRSCPSIGNHEWMDPATGAPGYFTYFGPRLQACATSGSPTRGYYSYDLANGWHVVSLSSECGRAADPTSPACTPGSPQLTWLQADLAAHAAAVCTLAYWHNPRWGSGFFNDDAAVMELWNALNHVHADVVLVGHEHHYARFGPMTPDGHVSSTGAGMRQLTVGTGGRSLLGKRIAPHPEGLRYVDYAHYGILRLTLTPTGWASEFRRTDGVIADRAASGCWR